MIECPDCDQGYIMKMVCYGNKPYEIREECPTCCGEGKLYCYECERGADDFCDICCKPFCLRHLIKYGYPEKLICVNCDSTYEQQQIKQIEDFKSQIKKKELALKIYDMTFKKQNKEIKLLKKEILNLKNNPLKYVSNDQLIKECKAREIDVYNIPKLEAHVRLLEMD